MVLQVEVVDKVVLGGAMDRDSLGVVGSLVACNKGQLHSSQQGHRELRPVRMCDKLHNKQTRFATSARSQVTSAMIALSGLYLHAGVVAR